MTHKEKLSAKEALQEKISELIVAFDEATGWRAEVRIEVYDEREWYVAE